MSSSLGYWAQASYEDLSRSSHRCAFLSFSDSLLQVVLNGYSPLLANTSSVDIFTDISGKNKHQRGKVSSMSCETVWICAKGGCQSWNDTTLHLFSFVSVIFCVAMSILWNILAEKWWKFPHLHVMWGTSRIQLFLHVELEIVKSPH